MRRSNEPAKQKIRSKAAFVTGVVGLAIPWGALGVGYAVAPRLSFPEWAMMPVAFAGALAVSFSSLGVLAAGSLPGWTRWSVAVVAVLGLGGVAWLREPSAMSMIVVAWSLISLAHVIGDLIGTRVEASGHILPASVVASVADLVSVIHPSGPSNAIAHNEVALDLLTVSFPVMGTSATAPSLGLGDLVFVALLLGVAKRFDLSRLRVLMGAVLGVALAGGVSAMLGRAIPALPFVGLVCVLSVPAFRAIRSRERGATVGIIVGVVLVGAAVIGSRFLPGE